MPNKFIFRSSIYLVDRTGELEKGKEKLFLTPCNDILTLRRVLNKPVVAGKLES